MAANREKIGIEMLVQPKLDQKAASSVLRSTEALRKKLSNVKVDWNAIAKSSGMSVQEIQKLSKGVSNFSKKLSEATRTSTTQIAKLNDALRDAEGEAADLRAQYSLTKDSTSRKKIGQELSSVNKVISQLNRQLTDNKKAQSKYGNELKDLTRAQKRARSELEQASKFSPKDMFKGITDSISKGAGGGTKGAISAVTGTASSIGQGIKGSAARSELEGGGAISGIATSLTEAAGAIGIIAMALGAFWQVVKAASEHQTKLNKALMEGTGLANNFTVSSDNYRKVIDGIRNAAIDAQKPLLMYGGTAEKSLKLLNAYTKDATGSIEKTRQAIEDLGGGDLTRGIETFSRNAIVYGKALNMEADEIGSMMGKFETEVGYGANQTQDLMSNIVKAAATANMPLTKFMGIFRSVLPDVELYQNRLEELTGTIKLLSKTMSPKDVKQFMDAFANGFKGADFKSRLKTTLITGTDFVSKTLGKDFEMKARTMAKNFEKYVSPEDFMTAMKGGEASMAKLMADAQAKAASKGAEISGTQIGDAMKLASYEGARQKGGALNTATALRGAGMYSTYKILKQESQTFVKGFDGLSEHVIKQLGISEQQYEMLRQTNQSMQVNQKQLQEFGKTTSVSLNKGLREAIATRKGIQANDVTTSDMQNATEEDLFQASELSNQQKDYQRTAEDLTTQQVTATTSIAEKIDNVIAFLLEKIYQVLQPILDVLDKMWNWISGNTDMKAQLRILDDLKKGSEKNLGGPKKEQFDMVADAVTEAVASGKTGDALAKAVADSGAIDSRSLNEMNPNEISKMGQSLGLNDGDSAIIETKFTDALKKNDVAGALGSLKDLPGDLSTNLMNLAVRMPASKEAERRYDEKTATRRDGTKEEAIIKRNDERVKKEQQERLSNANSDLETDMQSLSGATSKAAETLESVPDAPQYASTASPVASTRTDDPLTKTLDDSDRERGKEADRTRKIHEDAADTSEHIYDGINDVAGILKKGIKYERSWMGSQYKNFLKSTTYDAFQTALLEYAVLQEKMKMTPGMGADLVNRSMDVFNKGVGLMDVSQIGYGGQDASLDKLLDKIPSRQMGGPIPDTGLYNLHKGELVVPASDAASSGRGGGSNAPIVHMTINGTSLSEPQLKNAVYHAMSDLARRQ